jgi:hypothetical protein
LAPGAEGLPPAFRWFELLLYLTALGILLDLRTLRTQRLYWGHLLDFYRLRGVRGLPSPALPIALSVLAIGQQLLSGAATQALGEAVKVLPNVLNELPTYKTEEQDDDQQGTRGELDQRETYRVSSTGDWRSRVVAEVPRR